MKSVNIKDIARIAGVGVSTVSRVMNNHPDVKADTRKKVLDVIEELNYIPNNSARNLKKSRAKNIGIFVRGQYNPFFSKIVETIEEKIAEKGYSTLLHYHHNEKNAVQSAAHFIVEKKLKGLIILGGSIDKSNERYLEGLETPIVFASSIIDEDVDKSLFSSVIIENEKATTEAVEYLIELGHKKIAMISAERSEECVAQKRYAAYRKTLEAHKLEFKEEYLESGDYSFETGFQAMNRMLDKNVDITAVFVATDMMAIGAAKAIFRRGLRVPDDISVVGFDGLDYGTYFEPSLSTVRQPDVTMGEKGTELLFKLIEEGSDPEHVVLETELLKRESCRAIEA